MLFKQRLFPGLADGSITLAFRRWERARVKAGGTLRSPVGVLSIEAVDEVSPRSIREADARAAGYDSREELFGELDAYGGDGIIFRIRLRRAGEDPRVELRERATLDAAELDALTHRLARLDAASRRGPWTRRILDVIASHPEGTRATELAAAIDRDTPSFKLDVRKLKELGLTESLGTGYRISPRGRAFLGRRRPA